MSANTICCIIDFDGSNPPTDIFLVRELGWINYTTGKKESIRFDLTPYRSLTRSQEQGCLPFYPGEDEPVLPYSMLEPKIREIYSECRSDTRNVVAYKGGNYEKDILKRLSIPSLNLEDLGCPKFDDIKGLAHGISCGFHTRNSGYHCALAEVYAFRLWMINHYN